MQNQITIDELNGLLEKAKKGDLRAFETIVRTYQRYGLVVSFRILGSEDDAKDVVQEGFIRIWRNLKNYDSRAKFTTWMYKIIINLCYDRLKSEKRRKAMFDNITDETNEISKLCSADVEKEFSKKETAAIIKYYSEGLPEKQRIVFALRDLEDLSVSEVVDITGMSEASVKTNLSIARKHIRTKIIGLKNEK